MLILYSILSPHTPLMYIHNPNHKNYLYIYITIIILFTHNTHSHYNLTHCHILTQIHIFSSIFHSLYIYYVTILCRIPISLSNLYCICHFSYTLIPYSSIFIKNQDSIFLLTFSLCLLTLFYHNLLLSNIHLINIYIYIYSIVYITNLLILHMRLSVY